MIRYLIIGVAINLAFVAMNAVLWATSDTVTAPLFIGWHLGLIVCHVAIYGLALTTSTPRTGRFQ